MLTHTGLVLISIAIGILIGAAGVGGFFMPPALMLLMHMDIHQGMALSLFTFIFTGAAGTLFFHRKGRIGHHLDTASLSTVLAAVILVVGTYTSGLCGQAALAMPGGARQRWLILAAIVTIATVQPP